MTDVRITINTEEVIRQLDATPQQVRIAMRQAVDDATALILRDQKTYPPAPPNSTYRRTRTLGRSWTREITENGDTIRGRVGSNANVAPYNRYVQDEAMQARIHAGRWNNTIQGTVRNRQATVQRMFEDRLRAAVEDGRWL